MQLLITTEYTVLILGSTVLLLWPSGGHNAETIQRYSVIKFVTTRSEILRRIHTVKTARKSRLCCLFSNSTEYGATWNVLIFQVMYKLHSLTKLAVSISRSDCLALVTALTFVNIMMLDLGVF